MPPRLQPLHQVTLLVQPTSLPAARLQQPPSTYDTPPPCPRHTCCSGHVGPAEANGARSLVAGAVYAQLATKTLDRFPRLV